VKIYIKCLVPIDQHKIPVIKLLRQAFGLGLKEAKDVADKFHQDEIITFESDQKYSIRDLNKDHNALDTGPKLLEYTAVNGTNGVNREAFLEKLKFFAGLALDNDEPILAEDLLHVYNNHDA